MVLAIGILMNDDYSKNSDIIPYMLTCMGIVQILNGMDYYKQHKIKQSILMFSFGIFILAFIVIVK